MNTRNTGIRSVAREKYDLMTLVVIKLGEKEYNGRKEDEGYGLLRFLSALMYPHKEDFMDTISEYIDFSDNKELWKEAAHMTGLGQSVLNEGIQQGIQQGIQAMVLDNIEEKIPKERVIMKLQKRFGLTEEKSIQYYERFAPKV